MTRDGDDIGRLARALIRTLPLKALPRAGWVRVGVQNPESVAAHSWGIAWLVLVLCPDHIDRGRALAMAAVHDLPEVLVGDITPHDGISPQDKADQEALAMRDLVSDLPNGDQLRALWCEYEAGESETARFVKACDKLDMALQAEVYRATQNVDTAEFVDSALVKLPEGVLRQLVRSFREQP